MALGIATLALITILVAGNRGSDTHRHQAPPVLPAAGGA
jgi:hypothetical protein